MGLAKQNNLEPVKYDEPLYKERHVIECFLSKMKYYRRVFQDLINYRVTLWLFYLRNSVKKILSVFLGLTLPLYANQQKPSTTNVAVFCSADNKAPQQFKKAAYDLGVRLALHNLGLTTGGSQTGLMKEVIDGYSSTTKDLSNLYGIIPQVFFEFNVHHPAIPKNNLRWVESLYIRLQYFHELCDIVVILPGGFGTLHELMDFLVHNQLFASKKRIILLNQDDFWQPLLQQFQAMQKNLLLTEKHLAIIEVAKTIDECIEKITTTHTQHHDQDLESHFWEKEKLS